MSSFAYVLPVCALVICAMLTVRAVTFTYDLLGSMSYDMHPARFAVRVLVLAFSVGVTACLMIIDLYLLRIISHLS